MNRKIIINALSFMILALIFMIGSVQAETSEPANRKPEIEENAMAILKKMADFLSKTQRFSVTAEIGYDAVQNSGQKIEFGSMRNITILRPNRARVDVQDRSGSQSGVIFDGKEISVFSADQKVYATTPKTGTIDDAFDYFTNELDMVLPLSQLLSNNLSAKLPQLMSSLTYVERSTIAGISCDHMAGRNDSVDFQVWVSMGDKPLPQRIVITYRHEVGQPQFWAQFSNWNLTPKISDSLFAFVPPKGAQKIPFAPWKPASAEEETVEGGKK